MSRRAYLQCLLQHCIGNWKSDAVVLLEGKYRKMAHLWIGKGMCLPYERISLYSSSQFNSISILLTQLSLEILSFAFYKVINFLLHNSIGFLYICDTKSLHIAHKLYDIESLYVCAIRTRKERFY